METPLIIDISIAAVIVLFAVLGAVRGLIKSLAGLASTLAAVFFAYVLSGKWAEGAMGLMFPSIRESIAGSIDFSAMSVTLPVVGEIGLEKLGIDTAGLTESAADKITEIAVGLMTPLMRVVLFLALLIVFVVAAKIVLFLLDKLFKLPVLSAVNRSLGAAFGFVEGLVLVLAVIAAFKTLGIGFFADNAPGSILLGPLMSIDTIPFERIWPMIKDAADSI